MSFNRLQIALLLAVALVAVAGVTYAAEALDTADTAEAATGELPIGHDPDRLPFGDRPEAAFCINGHSVGDQGEHAPCHHHHEVRLSTSTDVPRDEALFQFGPQDGDSAVIDVTVSSEAAALNKADLVELADFLCDSGQQGTCRLVLYEVLTAASANVGSVFVAECGASTLSDSRRAASAAVQTLDEGPAEDMTVAALSDETPSEPVSVLNSQAALAAPALPTPVVGVPAAPAQLDSLTCLGAFGSEL